MMWTKRVMRLSIEGSDSAAVKWDTIVTLFVLVVVGDTLKGVERKTNM